MHLYNAKQGCTHNSISLARKINRTRLSHKHLFFTCYQNKKSDLTSHWGLIAEKQIKTHIWRSEKQIKTHMVANNNSSFQVFETRSQREIDSPTKSFHFILPPRLNKPFPQKLHQSFFFPTLNQLKRSNSSNIFLKKITQQIKNNILERY